MVLERDLEKVRFAGLDLTELEPDAQAHLLRLTRILPEAAFHSIREVLAERPRKDPARYAVKVLNQWHREGRYA